MNIIELQNDLEFFPDQDLEELGEQGGNERFPGWLVNTVLRQRIDFRERHETAQAQQEDANPPDITTQLVSEFQRGIGGIPGEQGGMDIPGLEQGIPSVDMSQMAQGPMSQQPQMMAARGGLVPGYHEGGDIPTHIHGDKYWQHKANESPSWMQEDPDAMTWLSAEREAEQGMGVAESDALREALAEGLSEEDRAIRGRRARWSAAGFDPEETRYSDIPGDQRTGPPLSSYFTGAGREHVPPEIKKLWQDYTKVREEVREDKSGQQWRAYTDAGVDLSDINSFMKTFYDWPDVPVDHLDLSGIVSPIRRATQRLPFMSSPEGERYLATIEGLPSATPMIDDAEATDGKGDVEDRTDRGGLGSPDDPPSLRGDREKIDPLSQAHTAVDAWASSTMDRHELNERIRQAAQNRIAQVELEGEFRDVRMDWLKDMMRPTDRTGLDLVNLGHIMSRPSREVVPLTQKYTEESQQRLKQEQNEVRTHMSEIYNLGVQSRKELYDARSALDNIEIAFERDRITKGEEVARRALEQKINLWLATAREAGLDERLAVELASDLKIAMRNIEGRAAVGAMRGATGPSSLAGTSFDPAKWPEVEESWREQLENVTDPESRKLFQAHVNRMRRFREKLMEMEAAIIARDRYGMAEDEALSFVMGPQ